MLPVRIVVIRATQPEVVQSHLPPRRQFVVAPGNPHPRCRAVEDEQAPRTEDSRDLRDREEGIGEPHDPVIAEDQVEALVGERDPLAVGLHHREPNAGLRHLGQAVTQLRRGEVEPGDVRATHRDPDAELARAAAVLQHVEPAHLTERVQPCGKTTMLRLVAGLEPVQSGRIAIDGQVLAEPGLRLPPEARRVGLMFQDFALFPHLRVVENIAFGLRGLRPLGARAARAELLAQVDLDAIADSLPAHSLGRRAAARGAWPRALAPKPDLMLLDEAFSSPRYQSPRAGAGTTLGLLRAAGTPTLVVTHDAEEAVRVGDRIHAMLDGRILQNGTPAELYAHPANPFVAGFFGPLNRFKGGWSGPVARRSDRSRSRARRRHGGPGDGPARGRAGSSAAGRRRPAAPGAACAATSDQPRPASSSCADGRSVEVRQAGTTDVRRGEVVASSWTRGTFSYCAPPGRLARRVAPAQDILRQLARSPHRRGRGAGRGLGASRECSGDEHRYLAGRLILVIVLIISAPVSCQGHGRRRQGGEELQSRHEGRRRGRQASGVDDRGR